MHFLLAQAVIERSLLDSIGTRASAVRYELDARLGQGATKWVVIGAAVVLLYWALRRR